MEADPKPGDVVWLTNGWFGSPDHKTLVRVGGKAPEAECWWVIPLEEVELPLVGRSDSKYIFDHPFNKYWFHPLTDLEKIQVAAK